MKSIDQFLKTISKLRGPGGCPWDKEQTHKTLKRYLIEETYEAIDAIDNNDSKVLMEELGDILLQVVLHAQIASEKKEFTFNKVVNYINDKMVSRHPHVFSNTKVNSTDEVMINWEKLKKIEKPQRKEVADGIPNSLPSLLKAFKISKRVAREGFEWKKKDELWETLEKELKEFKSALKSNNKFKQSEELGDLLFMIVNIARWYKLDPEENLNKGIKKFIKRYQKVKKKVRALNKDIRTLSSNELNKVWKDIKIHSR